MSRDGRFRRPAGCRFNVFEQLLRRVVTDHPTFGWDAFLARSRSDRQAGARAFVYTWSRSNAYPQDFVAPLSLYRTAPPFLKSLYSGRLSATAPEFDKDGHRYPRRRFTPHGVARADADGRLGLERLSRPGARRGHLLVSEAVTDCPFRSLWQATSQIPARGERASPSSLYTCPAAKGFESVSRPAAARDRSLHAIMSRVASK